MLNQLGILIAGLLSQMDLKIKKGKLSEIMKDFTFKKDTKINQD